MPELQFLMKSGPRVTNRTAAASETKTLLSDQFVAAHDRDMMSAFTGSNATCCMRRGCASCVTHAMLVSVAFDTDESISDASTRCQPCILQTTSGSRIELSPTVNCIRTGSFSVRDAVYRSNIQSEQALSVSLCVDNGSASTVTRYDENRSFGNVM